MTRYKDEDRQAYTDVSTVESQPNDLIPDLFPEGPYSTDLLEESPGKNKPWRIDQSASERFDYENRSLHEDFDRDYPGDEGYALIIPEVLDEP
ncbi:hypothetical protein [Paenibacillus harenae]|uniref:Uncharacterized protein n=1 Tax=Paenibacillus harenae TaxID=306543 RepID=A0ABT9TW75_PAEHA|nr:hypothetical protein [Paenibacillus harenae]MDQ0061164.1 hypothetical protein [Paenibacillus harenae]MDQ0110963.1 hypothetical protein [Paenibacillus harenae]